MIIFFNKKTGDIFGAINGRVHDQEQMKMLMENKNTLAEDVGRFIIGWEEMNSGEKIEHNLDKFEVLKKFEDNTPENPMDYKIDVATNNLIKK
jgi:hypothetical protein